MTENKKEFLRQLDGKTTALLDQVYQMTQNLQQLVSILQQSVSILTFYCPFCHTETTMKEYTPIVLPGEKDPIPSPEFYCEKCKTYLWKNQARENKLRDWFKDYNEKTQKRIEEMQKEAEDKAKEIDKAVKNESN